MKPLLEEAKILIIQKPAIGGNDDGHITIEAADGAHHSPNRFHEVLAVVGMIGTLTEQRIHHVRAPGDLQRLIAFLLFISRRDAFAFFRVVVIQHHGVAEENNGLRLLFEQPPNEQRQKELPIHPIGHDQKLAEKTFHLM